MLLQFAMCMSVHKLMSAHVKGVINYFVVCYGVECIICVVNCNEVVVYTDTFSQTHCISRRLFRCVCVSMLSFSCCSFNSHSTSFSLLKINGNQRFHANIYIQLHIASGIFAPMNLDAVDVCK